MSSALQYSDVQVVYASDHGPVQALSDLQLSVPEGQCVALLGTSGCGKSTVLRLANRMVNASEGQVRLRGRDIRELSPMQVRRQTGYVPQAGNLFPHWTVRRNVALPCRLAGESDARAAEMAEQAMQLVGLAPALRDRYPRQLSGGQMQRAAVARGLAHHPQQLLMDEPFSALDPISRERLCQDFAQLRKRLQLTVLLVTHDVGEAFTLGDQVAVMRAGRVEQCGVWKDFCDSPANDFVRDFLQASGYSPEEG